MASKDKNNFEFITPLSIEICIEKINLSVNSSNYFWLRGKSNRKSFNLYFSSSMRNSFNRNFYGTYFNNADGSTIIKGKFKLNKFVKVFVIIWSIILALFMIIAYSLVIYDSVSGSYGISNKFALILIFPAMFIGEMIMLMVGLIISKRNEHYIVEFIGKELMATQTVAQEM